MKCAHKTLMPLAVAAATVLSSFGLSAGEKLFPLTGEVKLPVSFGSDGLVTSGCFTLARWDFAYAGDFSDALGVEFDFRADDLSDFSAFMFHFFSGAKTRSMYFEPDGAEGVWRHIRIPKAFWMAEGDGFDWTKVTKLRMHANVIPGYDPHKKCLFEIRNFRKWTGDWTLVFLEPESIIAKRPAETWAFRNPVNSIVGAYAKLGFDTPRVRDTELTAPMLKDAKVVILPKNPELPASAQAVLDGFKARGGKVLSFGGKRPADPAGELKKACPELAEKIAARAAAAAARQAESARTIAAIPPRSGERRAVWCHRPYGLYGKLDWEASAKELAALGVTDLLVNLCWGGLAYYDSKVLPVSPLVAEKGDALALCTAACRKYGIRVHVWKVSWKVSSYGGLSGPQGEFLARMRAEGRLSANAKGKEEIWLCQTDPRNQDLEIAAMCELAGKAGVSGIHFDYIRFGSKDYCFCAGCRRRFEARLGKTVANWPKDVQEGGALNEEWRQFRRDAVTRVVAETSAKVRAAHPGVSISAATRGDMVTAREWDGQDWPLWCDRGYLDFACPMDYAECWTSYRNVAVSQKRRLANAKTELLPGLGLSCWQADGREAERLAKGIDAVRKAGFGGFAVYEADARGLRVLKELLTGPLAAAPAKTDITLEMEKFRLVVSESALVKSLVVKATGEECLDLRDPTPLFSVTQRRPFNNEIKLANPNKRTTYPACRLEVEKSGEGEERLIVGFRTAPYRAVVRVTPGKGSLAFTLEKFLTEPNDEHMYAGLSMDIPPVESFRLAQLPVRERANFGDWSNTMWDDRAAVSVMGTTPYADVDHEDRTGYRLLTSDLRKGLQLAGGSSAIVAGAGRDDFLASVEELENAFDLPRGVASRRDPRLNASILWTGDITPALCDEYIALAKKGGFRMMLIYYPALTSWGYQTLGDYTFNRNFPNGYEDLKAMLAKIRAAGITVGFHTLQTHIGFASKYVTPVADPRLNKIRRFTLAQPIAADGPVGAIEVFENPVDSPLCRGCRLLQFGGELFEYEGYASEPPYRFTGVTRAAKATRAAAHPRGEVGGVLDVSEFLAKSCYLDQTTDLQDEIARKIARIYDCGFEYCYFDGSEGVNDPCNVYVSLSQFRVAKALGSAPLFTEGAAKSHFGWHLQAGANAFDTFDPEVFKAKIVEYPFAEAPVMRKDFTRIDFGWWLLEPYGGVGGKKKTIGTQPDMWEFGTSRAAAWDCPATVQIDKVCYSKCPRLDDLLEVMRRWEDVRAKGWLTPAMKEALKSPTQEHHLYVNENGEYELHPIEMLPTPANAPFLRGFVFARGGRRTVAYWHIRGSGRLSWSLGPDETVAGLRYATTDCDVAGVRSAWAKAVLK